MLSRLSNFSLLISSISFHALNKSVIDFHFVSFSLENSLKFVRFVYKFKKKKKKDWPENIVPMCDSDESSEEDGCICCPPPCCGLCCCDPCTSYCIFDLETAIFGELPCRAAN